MRLFTGLAIPTPVAERLDALIRRMRPLARLRWSAAANLHVTTKFIGEWPAARLDELQQALARVRAAGPVPIRLSGLGWFPNPHQPRIFWAAIQAPAALAELARATEAALVPLGIAAENRPFTPHLTLARLAPGQADGLPALRREVAGLESTDFGAFEAEAFHLYLSEPDPERGGESRYTALASFALETGGSAQ